MTAVKCKKCGGTKQKGVCLICPMLAAATPPAAPAPAGWPKRSRALGAFARQVPELNARNKRLGINVSYESAGSPDSDAVDCIIPDRNERKKLLKAEGAHDRDGGYGD